MEIRSNVSRACHAAGRRLADELMVPETGAAACAAWSAAAAVAAVALPAIMSAMHLGGIW